MLFWKSNDCSRRRDVKRYLLFELAENDTEIKEIFYLYAGATEMWKSNCGWETVTTQFTNIYNSQLNIFPKLKSNILMLTSFLSFFRSLGMSECIQIIYVA